MDLNPRYTCVLYPSIDSVRAKKLTEKAKAFLEHLLYLDMLAHIFT